MQGKKRIFLEILAIILTFIFAFTMFVIYMLRKRYINLYIYFFVFLIGVLVLIGILILFVISASIIAIFKKKANNVYTKIISTSIDILYPIVVLIAKVLGIKREKIQQSFIEINNFLFSKNIKKYKPRDLLILSPHCIQFSGCSYKVTNTINNCRRCGKCQINDLAKLKDKFGVNIAVATGGTLARKVVQDFKPKAIVAIACERDLTSGILDVKKVPVYGIINERPYGPCFNTKVNIDEVENIIKKLIDGG